MLVSITSTEITQKTTKVQMNKESHTFSNTQNISDTFWSHYKFTQICMNAVSW